MMLLSKMKVFRCEVSDGSRVESPKVRQKFLVVLVRSFGPIVMIMSDLLQ